MKIFYLSATFPPRFKKIAESTLGLNPDDIIKVDSHADLLYGDEQFECENKKHRYSDKASWRKNAIEVISQEAVERPVLVYMRKIRKKIVSPVIDKIGKSLTFEAKNEGSLETCINSF